MNAHVMQDSLAPIRERFLTMLAEQQIAIQGDLEFAFENPAKAGPALERIMADLHKIAGTSGTLGFADLGNAARQAEYGIADLLDAPSGPATPVYLQIIDVLEAAMAVTGQAN